MLTFTHDGSENLFTDLNLIFEGCNTTSRVLYDNSTTYCTHVNMAGRLQLRATGIMLQSGGRSQLNVFQQ